MYAFGDEQKPDPDSVALVEDMATTFIVDLCHRARPPPQKIPVPSNQNTINTIAAGLLLQEGAGTGLDSSASTNDTISRKTASSTSSRAKDVKSISTKTYVSPRLAAHPYVSRPRMTVEDLKFACRKDAKMSTRIEELLYLDKVITDAQKAFNNPEEDVAEKTT